MAGEDYDLRLFRKSPIAGWIRGAEAPRFLDVTDAMVEQYGYSREELLRMTVPDLFAPEEYGRAEEYRRFHEPGALLQSLGFWTHYRKDGTRIQVEIFRSNIEFRGRPAVIAFALDVTERLKLERFLRESQGRYRGLIQASPDAVWLEKDSWLVFVNRAFLRYVGASGESEVLGRSPLDFIHPEDHEAFRAKTGATAESGAEPQPVELRMRRLDGTTFEVELSASPSTDGGEPAIQTLAHDISLQKRAERELRRLAAAVLYSQEEERRMVARELHDDLTQRLAFLGIELDLMRSAIPDELAELRQRAQGLHKQVDEMSADVRRLSHHLHPSALAQAGLRAALRSFCDDFSKQNHIATEVISAEEPSHASIEISTILYRIAQEALRNVAKHARAQHVQVILEEDPAELRLVVIDDGRGFDVAARLEVDGLGLVSMGERARLAGGRVGIFSEPGVGTRIEAVLPVQIPASHLIHEALPTDL